MNIVSAKLHDSGHVLRVGVHRYNRVGTSGSGGRITLGSLVQVFSLVQMSSCERSL